MSRPLPLARAAIDRAAHLRADDEWLAAAWRHPASRAFAVEHGRALVRGDALVWTPAREVEAGAGERFFLGVLESMPTGGGLFAVAVPLPDPLPEGVRAATLRDVGALLSDLDAGALAHAAALDAWHARHPRCPQCGSVTVSATGGHVRRCTNDGSEHYPRTDPAIIVLVEDDDGRALLGRQPSWPAGRMSTLAGYVEPGETLEHAVVREVFEEVSVRVGELDYVGSQPWPFPSSLMLAFTARASTTQIEVDADEIAEARWFTRDELRAALLDGSLRLPMAASVAFHLIDAWFGGDLEKLAPDPASFLSR